MSAGQNVGYIRVSTADQNTARQLDGMCLDRVFEDKASGKDTDRPGLAECLKYLREGDTLVCHSMDRLCRNMGDLLSLVKDLTGRGVAVKFAKEALVFTGEDSPMANLMMGIIASVAQFERSLILERQREGIAIAKAEGKYRGRRPSLTPERVQELRQRAAAGEQRTSLAKEFRISRSAMYNYLGSA